MKTAEEVAMLFNSHFDANVTTEQIKGFRSRNKLISGLTGRFEKGRAPDNKGKKWDEYMSEENQANCRKTTFKKGNTPINHKPVGSERIDSKDGYILVKVAEPNVWEHKHRVLWEKHHGKIPDKHRVIFLNGDRKDIRLENLMMVSFADTATMSSKGLFYEDPEQTKVGVTIAKIINKSGQKRREANGVKRNTRKKTRKNTQRVTNSTKAMQNQR